VTDRELILASQVGDTEAFGQLVTRYQQAAYGHALTLLGDREAARDATQDAFLAAFRALRRLDQDRPFFPWLYVILRNRCYSILRSRRPSQPLDDGQAISPDEPPDADAESLKRALSRLPATDREILVLKYIDGRRYREIAEMLGVPVATVTSRLHAARHRLMEFLGRGRELEK
jgi:RNA polymerase sigma-70 factor, ECF subfamily